MVNLSIIIPAKDEEKNLQNLLTDIKKQNWIYCGKEIDYEIIVADANSTDKTEEIARTHNAKIVLGGLPGIGRNNGAKVAEGDIFFMIDADVRITNKNFFVMTYQEFMSKGLDCAVMDNKPNLDELESPWKKNALKTIYEVSNLVIRGVQKTRNPMANGTCMIFRKESFFSVNGFDEQVYFGEDGEITKKMVNRGFKFGVLNHKIFVNISPRRPLKQGIVKFSWNTVLLDFYRATKGEITSKELYKKITTITNHFEK